MPPLRDDRHAIGRRAAVFGGFTLLSRIAGLARDMAIAACLGTRFNADAFYVAFRIPNLLRRLLAEGAMTMAFVPIYASYRRQSAAEAHRAASVILTSLLTLLLLLLLGGVVAAPWLVRLIATGFIHDPVKFELTVALTRVMFPYLLCVSVMALLMGMLQVERHFTAPAAAPIFLNLMMIAAAVWLAPYFTEPAYALAIGVVAGGLAQLAVQLPPLWRRHIVPGLSFAWRHPALRQLIRVMIPSLYGGAVYQLNVLMITLLASFLAEGSVSYLWYADRITEFPLGIFAVALATVTLPTLSDQQNARDLTAFKETVNLSLRIALAEAIPAAVGLILLARPIVRLLFERGAFSAASTDGTVAALYGFAVGIPFVSAVRNIVPAFYAMQRPRAPVWAATVGLVTNGVAALVLMRWRQHQGLALAMAVSSAAQLGFLGWWLRRLIGPFGGRRLLRGAIGSCAATLCMAGVVWGLACGIALTDVTSRSRLFGGVSLCIALGALTYLLGLRWLAREEYRHCVAMFCRRR
ncbi:MAG: murein biosynthesis integral membrane protein MurJ [Deltaproteobacteria bacterium]|nr:murein biosynthesis integral membrane protein MurJ [Deltaproteobacteria bacterium]